MIDVHPNKQLSFGGFGHGTFAGHCATPISLKIAFSKSSYGSKNCLHAKIRIMIHYQTTDHLRRVGRKPAPAACSGNDSTSLRMYIMYTCRCVCMSVNYEEDILWYSTKLIHHNKRHKTRKQRTLSPFERESSYLFIKKTGGIRFNM